MSLAEISFSLTKSLMNPWDLFLLSLLFGNIIIPVIDEYIILTYNYYMFKNNRLQIFGAFICFFSVIYAISYYDIYKGIQACNLCILDRYIFVAIGIIFSLSIWAKKKLLFLPLIIISFLLSCFGFIISARHIWLQKTSENNQNNDFANECSADFYYLFEKALYYS